MSAHQVRLHTKRRGRSGCIYYWKIYCTTTDQHHVVLN